MYDIIIFFIIVFPYAIRNYLRNSEYTPFARFSNFIISAILFVCFFEEFRIQIWDIYKNGFNNFYTIKITMPFSKVYYIITKISYFLLCFYLAGLSISLGLKKERSRKLFLSTMPVIWIRITNYFFQFYIMKTNEFISNKFIVVLVIGFMIGVLLLILYLIFSSKSIKLLFTKKIR
jgi:hypothetical protein